MCFILDSPLSSFRSSSLFLSAFRDFALLSDRASMVLRDVVQRDNLHCIQCIMLRFIRVKSDEIASVPAIVSM